MPSFLFILGCTFLYYLHALITSDFFVVSFPAQSVAENSVLGTVVGSVSAVDLDAGQTLSFSVSKGGYFSISGDSVVVSGSIDFEMTPTVIFEVQALDNGFPPLSVSYHTCTCILCN